MPFSLSVVVSTFNRPALLGELLDGLGRQSLPPGRFEVVVVDDGSKVPVAPALSKRADAFRLTVLTQANAGAAAARDAGVRAATGDVVVITDDDMGVPGDFLARHLAAHEAGYSVVLGHIAHDDTGAPKPLFERFHHQKLDEFVDRFTRAPDQVRGIMVCTGNVSFRREDYLRVGGFDKTLDRSEDRELGVRLQEAGARLYFARDAVTHHRSDHTDLSVWRRRNFLYGVYDSRIHKKHPGVADADPWHFLFLVNPVSRGLLLLSAAAPRAGELLSRAAYGTAEVLDQRRALHPVLEKAAIAGATLSYGLDYFRGVRAEAGSLAGVARGLASQVGSMLRRGRR